MGLMKEMSRLQIREDDLTSKNIADLLREHLKNMHEITPSESNLALLKRTNGLFSHLDDLNCGLREKIEIFCNSLRDSEACAIGDQPGEACAEAIACY
jgi:hypothetical protein